MRLTLQESEEVPAIFHSQFAVMLSVVGVGMLPGALRAGDAKPLEYNRDVRPILSDKCFRCHGPDAAARQADLRLDIRDAAVAKRDHGAAIVPGSITAGELIRRISSTVEEERMPPAASGLVLSAADVDVLRRWVAGGADYQSHWSLLPPRWGRLPETRQFTWPRNAIDSFVLARLEQENVPPSSELNRETLLRRLSFDITGLPPTLSELTEFLSDASPAAYDRTIDRLLASPRYGEEMARDWLDAARYADTNGYFSDLERKAWAWRDWVIHAYNANMPFDQFTIEQLAGDLLPAPTIQQRIATGFHRNQMVTNESGVIEEEYRTEYVVDRVDTTATVWLGLSVGCARCHDHKYDPISQREYYQLFAFFNSIQESGLVTAANPPPLIEIPTAEQVVELARLQSQRQQAEKNFAPLMGPLQQDQEKWANDAALTLPPLSSDSLVAHYDLNDRLSNSVDDQHHAQSEGNLRYDTGLLGQAAIFDGTQHLELPAELSLDSDSPWSVAVWLKAEGSLGCVLSKIEPQGNRRGFEVIWQKGRLQVNLVHRWGSQALEVMTKEPVLGTDWHYVVISYDGSRRAGGLKVFMDGESANATIERDSLISDKPEVTTTANSEPWRIGRRDSGLGFYGKLDELRILRRTIGPDEARSWYWNELLHGILATAPEKRTVRQNRQLSDYYVDHFADAPTKNAYAGLEVAKQAEEQFKSGVATTLVVQEMAQPRATTILLRGQYDQPGEPAQAGVPSCLPPLAENTPVNRLGLAQWLVSRSHPLTARVTVNRLWQHCFGEGLVATVNDFGAQGEPPTHPELLDWLAVRFMETGWDVKQLTRLIAMSSTYRQSAGLSAESLQKDSQNRLLSRGARFRLPAENIRDQALAVSGLLIERTGGRSVKPYQPSGLWEAVSYNGDQTYEQDHGPGLWRRSLYTYWKRQAPPAAILSFDGPTRETCVVRRSRTNTPLQALALLNDVTHIEAARELAARTMRDGGPSIDDRMRFAFRTATSRVPEPDEIELLRQLFERQLERFAVDSRRASALVEVGESIAGRELNPLELASWTIICQTLLNLDETITRP